LSGGWGQGVFVFFPLVPNVFPSSSQVPKVFLKMLLITPRFYPIWFVQVQLPCI
jgi:hypothetical protein